VRLPEEQPMTITPQDIQSKQFHVRLRGFDVNEVDKFLEKIAEEFLILSLEHKQAMERINNLEKEVANFRNKEQAFQNAILSAQKISDEMREKSNREADETLLQAREESQAILARAAREARDMEERAAAQARSLVENSSSRMLELTGEINRLIGMKERIVGDLRQLLEGYLQRLEEGVPPGLSNLEPLEVKAFDPLPGAEGANADQDKEPGETGEAETSVSADEADLENLYEKIDLSDLELDRQPEAGSRQPSGETEEMATLELADIEALDLDEDPRDIAVASGRNSNFEADIPIPDLGDDMLFSLEDPLDELEQSISIRNDGKNG
jgi:cell division initiation protein